MAVPATCVTVAFWTEATVWVPPAAVTLAATWVTVALTAPPEAARNVAIQPPATRDVVHDAVEVCVPVAASVFDPVWSRVVSISTPNEFDHDKAVTVLPAPTAEIASSAA